MKTLSIDTRDDLSATPPAVATPAEVPAHAR